jgi:hypothetical protein
MPDAPGIFISYNREDLPIAKALVRSITMIVPDNSKVFIDHAELEPGERYETQLADAIAESKIFIMICTSPLRDKDMSWCLYEAGQFRAKLAKQNRVPQEQGGEQKLPLIYLYDDERPKALSPFEGVHVGGADDAVALSAIYNLWTKIIKRVGRDLDFTNEAHQETLRENAKNFLIAWSTHIEGRLLTEYVLQPRITMVIPSRTSGMPRELTDDTVIDSEKDYLDSLFGILGEKTTWGEIKGRFKDVPRCLRDIENAILDISKNLTPKQTDSLLFSKRIDKDIFYRPIVARYKMAPNGKFKCYVAFIPTSKRKFNIQHKVSTIIIAMLFSIRFRQQILPLAEELKKLKGQFLRELLIDKFERELLNAEAESIEYGLVPLDQYQEDPVVETMHEEQDKEYMRKELADWKQTRNLIDELLEGVRSQEWQEPSEKLRELLCTAFEKWKVANPEFVGHLIDELRYYEKLNLSKIQVQPVNGN